MIAVEDLVAEIRRNGSHPALECAAIAVRKNNGGDRGILFNHCETNFGILTATKIRRLSCGG